MYQGRRIELAPAEGVNLLVALVEFGRDTGRPVSVCYNEADAGIMMWHLVVGNTLSIRGYS